MNASKKLQERFSHPTSDSDLNIFSGSDVEKSGVTPDENANQMTTADPNTKLVHRIIDEIFNEQYGFYDASSSYCSSEADKSGEYVYDMRLQYWKDWLYERRRMTEMVKKHTGKLDSEVLFNRSTTLDDRDKNMVKRLLDMSERMNPDVLRERKATRLKAYTDRCGREIKELIETLPKPERDGETQVEISGLPAVVQAEMLGPEKIQGETPPNHWLKCPTTEQAIDDRFEHIERVLEFYPDIKHLEVVGKGLKQPRADQTHDADIRYLGEIPIVDISSDTAEPVEEECEEEEAVCAASPPQPMYALKINGKLYTLGDDCAAKLADTVVHFECCPFEQINKLVLTLENVGRCIFDISFKRICYYDKRYFMLTDDDNEFDFNSTPFRMCSGDKRTLTAKYRPRSVSVNNIAWEVNIVPSIFCPEELQMTLKFRGKCVPHETYINALEYRLTHIIEKSNAAMVRKITHSNAEITPLIAPPDCICPYKRTLTEPELFEFYNYGYKCTRFHDLELLRGLYTRIKKPGAPLWDLRLQTLKCTILRLKDPEQRAEVFAELLGILHEMRGTPIDLELKLQVNPQRDHARYIYVRGIISAAVDEWEDMITTVELAFFEPALQEYYEEQALAAEEAAAASNLEEAQEEQEPLDEEQVYYLVTRKIRKRKVVLDTLYMHTYNMFCNLVENIVSSIEDTEMI